MSIACFCKLFLITVAIAEPVVLVRSHMSIRTLLFIGTHACISFFSCNRFLWWASPKGGGYPPNPPPPGSTPEQVTLVTV